MIFTVPAAPLAGSTLTLLPGNDKAAVADKFEIAAAAEAIVVVMLGAWDEEAPS